LTAVPDRHNNLGAKAQSARRSGKILISFSDKSVKVPQQTLKALVRFVTAREGFSIGRIDLAVVAATEIARHNRRFLNHAGATDVISFDLSDSAVPGVSAQIIVCASVAARQAKHHGLTKAQELMLYIIHGLLHVMGYDDLSVRDHAKMASRQDELLKEFLAPSSRRPGERKTELLECGD